jgi:hypothetical protein
MHHTKNVSIETEIKAAYMLKQYHGAGLWAFCQKISKNCENHNRTAKKCALYSPYASPSVWPDVSTSVATVWPRRPRAFASPHSTQLSLAPILHWPFSLVTMRSEESERKTIRRLWASLFGCVDRHKYVRSWLGFLLPQWHVQLCCERKEFLLSRN